jgi:hypothetical protein
LGGRTFDQLVRESLVSPLAMLPEPLDHSRINLRGRNVPDARLALPRHWLNELLHGLATAEERGRINGYLALQRERNKRRSEQRPDHSEQAQRPMFFLSLPLHAQWADAKVCIRCGAQG